MAAAEADSVPGQYDLAPAFLCCRYKMAGNERSLRLGCERRDRMIAAAPPILSAEGIQQRQLLPAEESIAIKWVVNCEGKRASSPCAVAPLSATRNFSSR